jgi:thioesterase domain-containing protein
LLRAPTVQKLARLLLDPSPSAYDPIVPLNTTGDGTPLFCVHAAIGEALGYVNLARYFTDDRPVFGIQARGLRPQEPPFTAYADMVQCYVAAIREVRPVGPYALAGHSFGGPVAFEITKALESVGERVEFLGVMDMPPHIKELMGVGHLWPLERMRHIVNLALYLSLVTAEQAEQLPAILKDLPERRRLEYLLEISPPKRGDELKLTLPRFFAWATMAERLRQMGGTFEPTGTVGRIDVFRADPVHGTKEEWFTGLKGWSDFSRTPVTPVTVPGQLHHARTPKPARIARRTEPSAAARR